MGEKGGALCNRQLNLCMFRKQKSENTNSLVISYVRKIFPLDSYQWSISPGQLKFLYLQHNSACIAIRYEGGTSMLPNLVALSWTPKEGEAPLHWREVYFVANKVQECIF